MSPALYQEEEENENGLCLYFSIILATPMSCVFLLPINLIWQSRGMVYMSLDKVMTWLTLYDKHNHEYKCICNRFKTGEKGLVQIDFIFED
jgi:hypothetical protein